MKGNLVLLFLSIFISSSVCAEQHGVLNIAAISKENSQQQQLLLKITDSVQSYQDNISEKYLHNLGQLPEKNISINSVYEILDYANEVPMINALELNVSYILDLTQNIFSLCELSDLIKSDVKSRGAYNSFLLKQLGYLTEELQEKTSWVSTVIQYYSDEGNAHGLKVSQSAKDAFAQMNQYYIQAQKNDEAR